MPSLTACDMLLTAQALTADLGVRVELVPNVATASTSRDNAGGFVIRIPAAPSYDSAVLPVTRGYLDHECGHVKYTDFDLMEEEEKRLVKSMRHRASHTVVHRLCNVFEDFRIEQLMCRYYPGSRINLRKLNEHIFGNEYGDVCLPDDFRFRDGRRKDATLSQRFLFLVEASLAYILNAGYETIYSVKLSAAVLRRHLLSFLPNHDYLGKIDNIVARAVALTRQEDIPPLVKQLLHLWYDMFPDLAEQADDPNVHHVNRDEPEDNPNSSLHGMPTPVQQTADEMLAGTGEAPLHNTVIRSQIESVLENSAYGDKGASVGQFIQSNSYSPMAYTQQDTQGLVAELGNMRTSRHLNLKQFDYKSSAKRIVDCIENQSRGLLRSALETMSFTRGKTGYVGNRLDTRALHRPSIGDGRLFHTRAVRRTLDTDIVILMDASASMALPIGAVNLAVHGIVPALRSLPGVNVCVATFGGQHFRVFSSWDQPLPRWDNVPAVFGSTPLAGATVKAAAFFGNRPAPRRMLFIASDGEPDNGEAFTYALRKVRAMGVEVYGIAMGAGGKNLKQYIPNTCHTDFDLKNFVPTLRNALVRSFKEDRRCNI